MVFICENQLFVLLGRKWNVAIIEEIDLNPEINFNQMLHKIHLITPKILADHLRFLQEEEIIKKEINSINPLRVSYQTTPKGKKILEIIKRIKELHDQESGTNCATRMCSECFWRERGSFQKVRRNSFLLVTTF